MGNDYSNVIVVSFWCHFSVIIMSFEFHFSVILVSL